jgi:hypothetical protein
LREPAARPAPPPAASINPSFSGQGSNTGLLLGSQSLQAGQTGTLTFTARVTYPAGPLRPLPHRPAPPAGYTLASGHTHPLDQRGLPVAASLLQVASHTLRLLYQE